MLVKNPGFTAVAVLTLALGIGGTTAIFSVVYGALLDPFPFADSHRLAVLVSHDTQQGQFVAWSWVSAPEFLDYREQNHAFDEVIGGAQENIILTGAGAPEMLSAVRVTDNYFRVLGVAPLTGRPITPADVKPGAPPVVVLGYRVWQRNFGGDPGIIGRTFVLNPFGSPRRLTTVIGVMPARFTPLGGEIYLPATLSEAKATDEPQLFSLLGHLKPGVSIKQASSDVAFLSKRLATVYPKDHPPEVTFGVESLADAAIGEFRKTLYLLLGAVDLLLLIGCVNVANLLLARATGREREFAIRAALGASRGRLVRQLLIESLELASGGAALGCLLAWNGLGALVAIIPPGALPSEAVVRVNGPVLLFTLGAALLSTLLFGLAPALLAVRKDLQEPLKASGRGSGEKRGHIQLRNLLVVSDVALSLVLLTGAALLIRSFFGLHRVELGYKPDHVLSVGANLPEEQYKTSEQRNQFHLEALRRMRAMPGVVSAALCNPPPSWTGYETTIEIVGKSDTEDRHASYHYSSDRLFETMGMRLLQGRSISEEDLVHSRKVAVINRTFATKYFAGERPLGQHIELKGLATGPYSIQQPWFEVVGVVADVKDNGLENPTQPTIYIPYTVGHVSWAQVLVRTLGEPAGLSNSARRELAAIDKGLVLESFSPQDELNLEWFSGPRFVTAMLAAFASLGLVLVSVGVYSVLSYAVSRRTQEIGIRMALGADATDVRRMVMISGLRWLAVGIGIGVPASIALAKILQNRIWGIKSVDPLTLVAVSLLLTAVGLAACYVPARRATKVDPMVALRYE